MQGICEPHHVNDVRFATYGQVLRGLDFDPLIASLNRVIPGDMEDGFCYRASVPEFEALAVCKELGYSAFGGLEIQVGYCIGRGSGVSCMEYHCTNEVLVFGTDAILCLGHRKDVSDGSYQPERLERFYVKAGTGVELYSSTLHYSPCSLRPDEMFRAACALPRGTNEPLGLPDLSLNSQTFRNKWLCMPVHIK